MPQSEAEKKRQLQKRRLRYLMKQCGYEAWIRQLPGLQPRTRRGFDYDAILEVVEYCVRYLVREHGMKRREAIRKIAGTIWGNLSSASARKKTSKGPKEFATRMEELLRPLQRGEVTIKLPDHSFCFALFANSILLPHSTTPQKISWLPSTAGEGSALYYWYVDASPSIPGASSIELFSDAAGIRFEERPPPR
jgi:hypothetical protein